jgi:hypothetical protein
MESQIVVDHTELDDEGFLIADATLLPRFGIEPHADFQLPRLLWRLARCIDSSATSGRVSGTAQTISNDFR